MIQAPLSLSKTLNRMLFKQLKQHLCHLPGEIIAQNDLTQTPAAVTYIQACYGSVLTEVMVGHGNRMTSKHLH